MPSNTLRSNGVLADVFVPSQINRALATNAALVLLFAGITSLCAQIHIRLPFTPVPITGQTFAVLLTGAALGPRRAFASMVLYVAGGAAGLHLYAGGSGGYQHIAGPTGGYLLSYPLAAMLVGALAYRGWDRSWRSTLAAMLLGSLVIYGLGVAWLAFFVGGIGPAVVKGMLPFLPGDLIKAGLAAIALPGAWELARQRTDDSRQ